ncbi:MAG: hypothetical protein ABIP51_00070, partial [Bacteroidia bacterium]
MGTERLIKNEVVRFSAELGIIATFLTIGIETASHFSEVLHSSKFIVAVLASMYVVTLRVCWQIKNPQKDAYGKPRYDHSESKKAWAGRIMIISSVLIPLSIAGILYFNQKTLSNNIAIITTRFEKDKDPFHTKLNELIKKYDEKNHLDSVDLKFQNKYYDDYVNFNTDSMLNIFNCNNAKRGLLVIGSKNYDHDDEDFFYCYIYINQLANLNMNKNLKDIDTSFHSDNIIHLLEQRFISFSTFTQQAEELAKFIMGLLYFNAGDLEKASETFTDIKNNAASAPSSSKLSATCSEWLGHISVRKNDVPKALGHYLESAEKDSANLPLLNNIGGLYYHQKDTVNAYKYFLKAKALDDNYTIPINQPTSSGPVSAAPKDNTDDASKLAEQKQLADEKKKAEAKKKEDQRIADEKKKEDERIAEVKKQA